MSTTGLNLAKSKKVYEMIEANSKNNKDEAGKVIMIKKLDESFFHVLQQRITVLPSDITHPVSTFWVQQYDELTWERMEKLESGGNKLSWQRCANISSARVVHDPTLLNKVKK